MKKKNIDIDFRILSTNNFSSTQWKEFYNSLKEERKTWDIDRQQLPDLDTYMNFKLHPDVASYSKILGAWCNDTNKLVGTFDSFFVSHPEAIKAKIEMFIHSYIIKKEYQQNGLAKIGLNWYVEYLTTQYFNCYPDFLKIKHIARIHDYNKGSIKLVKSLGFIKKNLVQGRNDQHNYILDKYNIKNQDSRFFKHYDTIDGKLQDKL